MDRLETTPSPWKDPSATLPSTAGPLDGSAITLGKTRQTAIPLQPEERGQADRVARRLHGSLRALMGALPQEARNASGMARVLGVDRTTCQRMVHAVRSAYVGPDLLSNLPGVKGLLQLTEAAKSSGLADEDVTAKADAAITQFDNLITKLAGSQTKLARRLEASRYITPPQAAASDTAGHRRQMFESAAALTGRYSDSWVAAYIYHPTENPLETINVSRAYGLIGHHASADAVPLCFSNFSDGKNNEKAPKPGLIGPGELPTAPGILGEFSSNPSPLVSTTRPGEFMVQAIDIESNGNHQIDLMFAATGKIAHPDTQPINIEEVWALVNFPVRRLVLDAYLHQDYARASIPSLATHLWRPDFASQTSDRWQTRFADGPKLQVLGPGLDGASTQSYRRQPELTRLMFERCGLNPEQFVGYRCEIEYPIWRTGYCISFDYTKPDRPEFSNQG